MNKELLEINIKFLNRVAVQGIQEAQQMTALVEALVEASKEIFEKEASKTISPRKLEVVEPEKEEEGK